MFGDWLVRQTQVITHRYSVHTTYESIQTPEVPMPMSQCNRSTCVDFNTCNFHSRKKHESYLIGKCYAVGRLPEWNGFWNGKNERINVEYHVAPINYYSIVQMLLPLHGKTVNRFEYSKFNAAYEWNGERTTATDCHKLPHSSVFKWRSHKHTRTQHKAHAIARTSDNK